MSALKVEQGESRVRAEDAVEIIDCGRASEQTKGMMLVLFMESATPPNIWFL